MFQHNWEGIMPSSTSSNNPFFIYPEINNNETLAQYARRTFGNSGYYGSLSGASLQQNAQPVPALPPVPSPASGHWSSIFEEVAAVEATRSRSSTFAEELLAQPLFEPRPIPEKWPIGTILRLQENFSSFHSIISEKNITREFPLIKVLGYSNEGKITKLQWIGCPQIINEKWKTAYFAPANDNEIQEYNRVSSELRTLTERPAIGVVIESLILGHPRGMRAVVLSHAAQDKILIKCTNEKYNFLNGTVHWDVFRIAENQKYSFDPDPSNYCQCENCQSTREISHTLAITNVVYGTTITQRFCNNDCAYLKGYFKCPACGQWEYMDRSVMSSDGDVCVNCWEEYYNECCECGQHHHRNNITYSELTLEYTCYRCTERGSRIIHDYSFKPVPRFNKMAWENTRYLGIELEVEHKSIEREAFAKRLKKWLESNKSPDYKTKEGEIVKGKTLDKLIYFKHDGSLSNGIEIVFHPYTLKAFHLHFPLQSFLGFLRDQGADISSGKCGMHVHVSKERLTNEQLIKGKWLFFRCEPFLKKFSGRKFFNYCYFEKEPTSDPYHQEYGRHTAFNTASSLKTIEIRLFNATLEHKKFLANLQFSDVFVDYIQNGAGLPFLKNSSPHIVWQNFIDYAKRNGRYQVLTNYILQNAIV